MRGIPRFLNTDTIKIPFETQESGTLYSLSSGAVALFDTEDPLTPITSGVTLSANVDLTAGKHLVTIVGSTAGLTVGKEYILQLTAGTANSNSVAGLILAQFLVQSSNLFPAAVDSFKKYHLSRK